MRIIAIVLLFLFSGHDAETGVESYPGLESEFPVLWKTRMGIASFRTNIVYDGNRLIMGSNGDGFMDFSIHDKLSGIYVIDGQSGKILKKFADEKFGDMDVNGILVHDGRYYFGNDNEEFLCTDNNGKIIWRNLASGDVEHEPVLLRLNGRDVIVYASETGEVKAVDPMNGNNVWNYYTPDFEGYKLGDNRSVFKVKSYFSNTVSFFRKPELCDLDKDGVNDVVYLTWDDKIYALNGLNGHQMWVFESDKALSFDFVVSSTSAGPLFNVVQLAYNGELHVVEDYILTIGPDGKLIEKRRLVNESWDNGLNHFSMDDTSIVNTNDSLYFISAGRVVRSLYHDNRALMKHSDSSLMPRQKDPLFSSSLFSFRGHPRCIFLLNQKNYQHPDAAIMEIISLDNGEVLKRFSIPKNTEMPPQVRDINGDGYLDLLISSYDGYLYCYNMKVKAF